MRCFSSFALAFGLICSMASGLQAQDLPTTHDHGITISPDHLTGAIQDSQDFWGPVRKYLVSEECSIDEAARRAEAVAFLKRVHDGLHERLFNGTETEAVDLVDYLGHRLRMFEVYRKLRTTVGDDALLVGLIRDWEAEFRSIHKLPLAEQAAKADQLVIEMTRKMQLGKLDEAKIVEASKLWKIQASVVEKMSATHAGKMMIHFETTEGDKLAVEVGALLLTISSAADWVLITREVETSIGRDAFVKAYAELQNLRGKYETALKPAQNR
ncbi:MAG: hypothetical protein K8U03_13010 [Planctomycetia bacterium]|nr:hypothetical protein [Planctomycetia bacterium]